MLWPVLIYNMFNHRGLRTSASIEIGFREMSHLEPDLLRKITDGDQRNDTDITAQLCRVDCGCGWRCNEDPEVVKE